MPLSRWTLEFRRRLHTNMEFCFPLQKIQEPVAGHWFKSPLTFWLEDRFSSVEWQMSIGVILPFFWCKRFFSILGQQSFHGFLEVAYCFLSPATWSVFLQTQSKSQVKPSRAQKLELFSNEPWICTFKCKWGILLSNLPQDFTWPWSTEDSIREQLVTFSQLLHNYPEQPTFFPLENGGLL